MSALGKILVTILFVLIIFWLSVFNREPVDFSVYPLFETFTVPLALIILAAALIGFVWGALIIWLNGSTTRSEVSRLRREVKILEKENHQKVV